MFRVANPYLEPEDLDHNCPWTLLDATPRNLPLELLPPVQIRPVEDIQTTRLPDSHRQLDDISPDK